jgi:hypothetical protein
MLAAFSGLAETIREIMNRICRLGLAMIVAPLLGVASTTQGTGNGGPIPSSVTATSGVVTSDIVLSDPSYVAAGNAITVTLLGLQHDFSGDLQITLSYVSSTGATLQSVDVINRLGATSANPYGSAADFGNNQGLGDNYQFNTDYPGNIWSVAACADTPTCSEPYGDADSIPGVSTDKINKGQYFTSTTGGTKTNLSYAFAGMSVSGGTWRLTITDAADSNAGSFIGWQISIATTATAPAATISAVAGTPQSATVSTSFASALQAQVTDASSNPVSGVTVTFTAPSSGPSATFSESSSTMAVTNSSGIARSPIPVANSTAGAYTVSASAAGLTSASFSLTNTALSTTPQVTLSPTSLNFGSQSVGTSTSQTLTVTNSGTGPLSISSLQVSGTNASDFSATGCTSSVAASGACRISVTFDPLAAGSRSATLSINDNASGSPQTVSLSGTGSSTASPSTFTTYLGAYGSIAPAYNGASILLPLRVYLPSGASQINFAMTYLNNASSGAMDYVIIAQSDGAGNYTLRFTDGTSFASGSYLTMSAAGTTVTLPTPMALGAMQITAYRFALVGNEFQLDLSVTRNGTFNDQIVILAVQGDNVAYSYPWYAVNGTWNSTAASAPAVSLSSTTVAFGNQSFGSSSNQTLTVTNSGTAPLSISSLQISGANASDFSAGGCTSSVAAGSACSISVTFDPLAAGSRSATLSINDNASASPQTVGLSGTGLSASAPAVTLSSTNVTFASQSLGSSTNQSLTVTNSGTALLSISSLQIGGANASDFSAAGCTSSVPAGGTCSISVTFTPLAAGPRSAILFINDNASGSPQTVTLSGTGSSAATPTTLTTYLGTYGSAPPAYSGASILLPVRVYLPAGASQLNFAMTYLNNASSGAMDYVIIAQSDGAGNYTLRFTNATSFASGSYLTMSATGATVTLPAPMTLGPMQITAYRFALVGNEFQLDLSITRSDSFNEQIVVLAVEGDNAGYSYPWYAVNGTWNNP